MPGELDTQLDTQQETIAQHFCWDEPDCVNFLHKQTSLTPEQQNTIQQRAVQLIDHARHNRQQRNALDAFLEEFNLSSTEGTILMCLAEALLRIPDTDTADELIQEKLLQGNWQQHVLQSDSLLVNASTWGLLLTGKWLNIEGRLRTNRQTWLAELLEHLGEPLVRRALLQAMRIMANQYILGPDIASSIKRGHREYGSDARFSFDALGEGARTGEDADRHLNAYRQLIDHLAAQVDDDAANANHSISIKLSAIHPRYAFTQRQRVMDELLPRARELCIQARRANTGLSIDAEEAERLDICLLLFRELALDPALTDWGGLGFVLQAYQKRATLVARWLETLAAQRQAPLNVRLVKGAYWDREIKRSQQLGLADYPVFTRKCYTDLSYLVCAKQLLDSGPEKIFPQFATHNAATIALIETLTVGRPFEFQRLHGMGDLIYHALASNTETPPPARIYAPLGNHNDLLPYLVRRLLENGANSSFINRFLDDDIDPRELALDPITLAGRYDDSRNRKIPLPAHLYPDRPNASGMDVQNPCHLREIESVVKDFNLSIDKDDKKISADAVETALNAATAAQPAWDALGGEARSQILRAIAQQLEQHKLSLMACIVREAGRTLVDAESEIREAIDFCHYYALQARQKFGQPAPLPGPTGEENHYQLGGRGVFLCISPWNFPTAIFTGQICAALAAGNSVIAKPAEQTPATGLAIVEQMQAAGVPPAVLHCLPGDGVRLGQLLVPDPRISGIAFTGSTATARHINRQLAQRDGPIVPLIAETGGINCMIVDSSALFEQVVDDIVGSAFLSAGQRCSALRVLYIQEDIADALLAMLFGACDQLTVGDPACPATDIGPVIDAAALSAINNYLQQPDIAEKIIYRYPGELPNGNFLGPRVIAVDSLEDVQEEVFGPVLHVIRFRGNDLDSVIESINQCPYALTLGIHSRIESRADYIYQQTRVGNTYINRNMVGAVVGVQPFGGHKLSGTGPKAGGPDYLNRFAIEKSRTVNTVATGGNTTLFNLEE